MTPRNELPEEEWRTLARQASKEEDPDKALELAQRIVEKYEEEKAADGIASSPTSRPPIDRA